MNGIERPLLISLIGYLHVFLALLLFVAAVALFMGLSSSDMTLIWMGEELDLADYATLGSLVLVVGGLLLFLIGYAFLQGWTVAWYLVVIINALDVVMSILTLPAGAVSLVISAVILYYLFRPKVKRFFKV